MGASGPGRRKRARTGMLGRVLLALALAAGGGQATGQATRPATAPATPELRERGPYEAMQLRRRDGSRASTAPAAADTTGSLSTTRVALALAVVVGVILALRYVLRQAFAMPSPGSSRAIAVLSRTAISPRQQLMLVQVGRRLVLVANCTSQMNALCEITDPEEIASLLGQIQEQKAHSITSAFSALLGRAGRQYDVPAPEADVEAAAEPAAVQEGNAIRGTRRQLNALVEKVQGLSRQFGR